MISASPRPLMPAAPELEEVVGACADFVFLLGRYLETEREGETPWEICRILDGPAHAIDKALIGCYIGDDFARIAYGLQCAGFARPRP